MLILTQSSCTKCRCFVSFLFLMWFWLVLDTAPQSRCYSRACPNILKRWRILPAHISWQNNIETYQNTKRSPIKFSDKCKVIAVSRLLTRSFTFCGLYRSEFNELNMRPSSTATLGRHKRWLLNFAIRHQQFGKLENSKCRIKANLSPVHEN